MARSRSRITRSDRQDFESGNDGVNMRDYYWNNVERFTAPGSSRRSCNTTACRTRRTTEGDRARPQAARGRFRRARSMSAEGRTSASITRAMYRSACSLSSGSIDATQSSATTTW